MSYSISQWLLTHRKSALRKLALLDARVKLSTAGGSPLDVVGALPLPLRFGQDMTPPPGLDDQAFLVVRGLQPDLILGMDFLAAYDAEISLNPANPRLRLNLPWRRCKTDDECEDEQERETKTQAQSVVVPLLSKTRFNELREAAREALRLVPVEDTGGDINTWLCRIEAEPNATETADRITADKAREAAVHVQLERFEKDELHHLVPRARYRLMQVLRKRWRAFAVNPDAPACTTELEMHVITVDARPQASKVRWMAPDQAKILEEQVRIWLEGGKIVPSTSPWNSCPLIVPKPNGGYRVCIDYRRLNAVTRPEDFPPALVPDLLNRLNQPHWLSSFDLANAYFQIPLATDSQEKTAFSTPSGRYHFTAVPFGLRNAPAVFNAYFARVLQRVRGFPPPPNFFDDVALGTRGSFDEHVAQIDEVLRVIVEAGLQLKLAKCEFGKEAIRFCGHLVSRTGRQPDRDHSKVTAIVNCRRPESLRDLRSFLGAINFFRDYIPRLARIAAPLYRLTSKGTGNRFVWGEVEDKAFVSLRNHLARAPVLTHVNWDISEFPFTLATDASQSGIGACLLQRQSDGSLRPVCYMSRGLLKSERNYATTQREALAIVWAVQALRPYLQAGTFTLRSDHKPLKYLVDSKSASESLNRWFLSLSEYAFKIEYVQGKDNVVADFLSRAFEKGHIAALQQSAATAEFLFKAMGKEAEVWDDVPAVADPTERHQIAMLAPDRNLDDLDLRACVFVLDGTGYAEKIARDSDVEGPNESSAPPAGTQARRSGRVRRERQRLSPELPIKWQRIPVGHESRGTSERIGRALNGDASGPELSNDELSEDESERRRIAKRKRRHEGRINRRRADSVPVPHRHVRLNYEPLLLREVPAGSQPPPNLLSPEVAENLAPEIDFDFNAPDPDGDEDSAGPDAADAPAAASPARVAEHEAMPDAAAVPGGGDDAQLRLPARDPAFAGPDERPAGGFPAVQAGHEQLEARQQFPYAETLARDQTQDALCTAIRAFALPRDRRAPQPAFPRLENLDAGLRTRFTNAKTFVLEAIRDRKFIFGRRHGLITRLHPTDGEQFVVPYNFRQRLMNDFHRRPEAGHFALDRMLALLRRTFWWPGMRLDIQNYIDGCAVCRQVHADPHSNIRVFDQGTILYALQPRAAWHVDYIGPLPESAAGDKYLALFIDEYSCWVELFPVQSTSLQHFTPCLERIIERHGYMRMIRSDNGSPFNHEELTTYLAERRIRHVHSPPLAPQANGRAESSVRTTKWTIIKTLTEMRKRDVSWADVYGKVQLAINSAPTRAANNRFTVSELHNGQPLLNAAEQLILEDERVAVEGGRDVVEPDAGELNRVDFEVRRDARRAAALREVETHRAEAERRKAAARQKRTWPRYEEGETVWYQHSNEKPALKDAMISSGNPQNSSAGIRVHAEVVRAHEGGRTYTVRYYVLPNPNRRGAQRRQQVRVPREVLAKAAQLRRKRPDRYVGAKGF